MNSSTFLLLLRLGLSLALVFGLMWVVIRVLRGRDSMLRRHSNDSLEILERKPLTKGSSIAIVRIADRTVALGITEQRVTLLTPDGIELADRFLDVPSAAMVELATPIDISAPPAARSSGSFLDTLRDLTVRHEERVDR